MRPCTRGNMTYGLVPGVSTAVEADKLFGWKVKDYEDDAPGVRFLLEQEWLLSGQLTQLAKECSEWMDTNGAKVYTAISKIDDQALWKIKKLASDYLFGSKVPESSQLKSCLKKVSEGLHARYMARDLDFQKRRVEAFYLNNLEMLDKEGKSAKEYLEEQMGVGAAAAGGANHDETKRGDEYGLANDQDQWKGIRSFAVMRDGSCGCVQYHHVGDKYGRMDTLREKNLQVANKEAVIQHLHTVLPGSKKSLLELDSTSTKKQDDPVDVNSDADYDNTQKAQRSFSSGENTENSGEKIANNDSDSTTSGDNSEVKTSVAGPSDTSAEDTHSSTGTGNTSGTDISTGADETSVASSLVERANESPAPADVYTSTCDLDGNAGANAGKANEDTARKAICSTKMDLSGQLGEIDGHSFETAKSSGDERGASAGSAYDIALKPHWRHMILGPGDQRTMAFVCHKDPETKEEIAVKSSPEDLVEKVPGPTGAFEDLKLQGTGLANYNAEMCTTTVAREDFDDMHTEAEGAIEKIEDKYAHTTLNLAPGSGCQVVGYDKNMGLGSLLEDMKQADKLIKARNKFISR